MGLQLISQINPKYVYIKTEGEVVDFNSYKTTLDEYVDIIQKSNLQKSLINEAGLTMPLNKEFPIQVVDYQNRDLPFELRNWKIANITTPEYMDIYLIWETASQIRGFEFKTFLDEKTAKVWLLD